MGLPSWGLLVGDKLETILESKMKYDLKDFKNDHEDLMGVP